MKVFSNVLQETFQRLQFLISLHDCYPLEICYFIVVRPNVNPDPSKGKENKKQPTKQKPQKTRTTKWMSYFQNIGNTLAFSPPSLRVTAVFLVIP